MFTKNYVMFVDVLIELKSSEQLWLALEVGCPLALELLLTLFPNYVLALKKKAVFCAY